MKVTEVSKIKKKLNSLPILNSDKVNLWLVYKGLKKATTCDPGENKFSEDALREILELMDLEYRILDDKRRYFYCVAQDADVAEEVVNNIYKLSTMDRQIHLKLGELFIFPKDAVHAYADNIEDIKNYRFEKIVNVVEFNKRFKHLYWEPYVRYCVRRGYEMEDSQQGKAWADEIRKELPELAKKFEAEIRNSVYR